MDRKTGPEMYVRNSFLFSSFRLSTEKNVRNTNEMNERTDSKTAEKKAGNNQQSARIDITHGKTFFCFYFLSFFL